MDSFGDESLNVWGDDSAEPSTVTTKDIFDPAARRMAREGLRLNNERAVLMAIATAQGASAAQISRRTGLGSQTVGRIVDLLVEGGLVRRGEALRGQRGQPAIPVSIDPDGAYCIGCEVGWRHLHILIRNLGGEVLAEHRRDYAFPDARTLFDELASLSRLMVGVVPMEFRDRVLGMGLAIPASIARNINLVGGSAADAAAWQGFDVAARVRQATGLEIFLLNDGNAACWGELVNRPPPRPDNMAYFLVGTFVGAGLIAEGRLWEGPTGNSANLGSMLVTGRDGKQNFVHLIASIEALRGRLVAAAISVPAGNPMQWDWPALGPIVDDWLEDGAYAIAKTIINTSAVMEFGIAVVDGALPREIVTRLVERTRHHLAALPTLTADRPSIEKGSLGGSAPAMGAALKPIYRRYFSRERDDISS